MFLAGIETTTQEGCGDDFHERLAQFAGFGPCLGGAECGHFPGTLTLQIFSAVPVFGEDETYIALLVERNGDAWGDRKHPPWTRNLDTFVMFCAGPDGSHKTQVKTRGNSWVCPWPREEWESKHFKVFLEDKNGTNLGMVLAEHDPKLLGHLVGNVFFVTLHV